MCPPFLGHVAAVLPILSSTNRASAALDIVMDGASSCVASSSFDPKRPRTTYVTPEKPSTDACDAHHCGGSQSCNGECVQNGERGFHVYRTDPNQFVRCRKLARRGVDLERDVFPDERDTCAMRRYVQLQSIDFDRLRSFHPSTVD